MRLLNTKMHFLIAIQAIGTQKGEQSLITKYTSNYYGLLRSYFNNILVTSLLLQIWGITKI